MVSFILLIYLMTYLLFMAYLMLKFDSIVKIRKEIFNNDSWIAFKSMSIC